MQIMQSYIFHKITKIFQATRNLHSSINGYKPDTEVYW